MYEIYLEISTSRPYGHNGPLGITDRNVLDYFERYEITDRLSRSTISDFVDRIDPIWLKKSYEKSSAEKPKPVDSAVKSAR